MAKDDNYLGASRDLLAALAGGAAGGYVGLKGLPKLVNLIRKMKAGKSIVPYKGTGPVPEAAEASSLLPAALGAGAGAYGGSALAQKDLGAPGPDAADAAKLGLLFGVPAAAAGGLVGKHVLGTLLDKATINTIKAKHPGAFENWEKFTGLASGGAAGIGGGAAGAGLSALTKNENHDNDMSHYGPLLGLIGGAALGGAGGFALKRYLKDAVDAGRRLSPLGYATHGSAPKALGALGGIVGGTAGLALKDGPFSENFEDYIDKLEYNRERLPKFTEDVLIPGAVGLGAAAAGGSAGKYLTPRLFKFLTRGKAKPDELVNLSSNLAAVIGGGVGGAAGGGLASAHSADKLYDEHKERKAKRKARQAKKKEEQNKVASVLTKKCSISKILEALKNLPGTTT